MRKFRIVLNNFIKSIKYNHLLPHVKIISIAPKNQYDGGNAISSTLYKQNGTLVPLQCLPELDKIHTLNLQVICIHFKQNQKSY